MSIILVSGGDQDKRFPFPFVLSVTRRVKSKHEQRFFTTP